MKFINRKSELEALNEKWESGDPQMVILYGKRRVGKTELMKQFGKKKPFVYFLADKRNQIEQLREFGRIVGEFSRDTVLVKHGFTDWIEAFQYLKNLNKQFVLAVDEYPYLVESDPATSSLFSAWARIWSPSRNLSNSNILPII